jgi:GT2 family glycosyltransferase
MYSIIIVSYHSDYELELCINSIIKHNDIGNTLEIIVVDNARSIKTKKTIESYDGVHYVEGENAGFGHANNIGASLAKNDYLLFLNPDTILVEPILKFAAEQFSKDKDLRAFGMLLVDERGAYQETFGFFPETFKIIPESFYLPLIKLGYSPSQIFPWGADIFVRKADFFAAGMFDEKLFMCYEEPDLVHRLPSGKIKIFPKKIIHKAGHTTGDIAARYKRALASEKYYFSKYGLDYKRYVRHTLNIIRLSVLFRKISFMKHDRQLTLYNLYKNILSSLP